MIAYLDSSAIVKRYLEESGSEFIDNIYDVLEKDSNLIVAFSIWNIGEVFGAFDERCKRGDIRERSLRESISLFVAETTKLVTMRRLNILPISGRTLSKARELVLLYHIYQADALQLASAKDVNSNLFLSADKRLVECAKSEQVDAANPERDGEKITQALLK